jgi:acetyl esterase/lipase
MSRFVIILFGVGSLLLQASSIHAQPAPAKSQAYETESNILYRTGNDLDVYMKERCQLDLYYPVNTQDFATVVWFHGGGLTGGERSIPEGLKKQGIAIITANYRLSPKVKSPAFVEDAAAAVAWTFENIHKYGGSTRKIYISGHSAGGYLAMMVGLDKKWLEPYHINPNDIAGLIPLSGQTVTHFTVRAEQFIPAGQPTIDEMAPLFHVRKDAPPMLLVTGDRELEFRGRYEENAYMWRMMKVNGHPDVELNELDGYDHGQMVTPGLPLILRFINKHSSK